MIAASLNNRGTYSWIPVAVAEPPSMLIPEDEKGEAYHAMWMRYFLSRQQSQWINAYRGNFVANMAYAIDSRWGEEDDERMFLGDGAAQTSRIPFKFPMVGPMLTRMVGAVDNISISAKAVSATQYFAQTRKEAALQERLVMSQAASQGPMMAGAYKSMGISPDPEETEKMFDMSYQDHIKRGANSLMAMLAERNKLDDTKRVVAQYMALSGVGAFHNFVNGANIETELCEPREVGWDTSALRPDFSDGQFVYVCPLMDVTSIAERWNPKKDMIRALDKWAKMLPSGINFNAGWPQSRPRVFTLYWKDMKSVERGFIMKDGDIHFCTVNQNDPDTGKVEYTDKDLIDVPINKFTLAWTEQERRDKKQKRSIQIVRYCSMIPWEYLPGGYTRGLPWSSGIVPTKPFSGTQLPNVGIAGDMVFDYGEYALQEADPDDVFSVKFPIKLSAWRYLGGLAVAPLTAALDPQRWMNQITSDMAYRLRVAGGKLTVIAKEAVAGTNYNEQDMEMMMKEGGVAFLPAAMLGGLPQATAVIDSSPSSSFYSMLSLLPTVKGVAEGSVGVYESNFGAPQGQDQLVGTLQLQLQQAGVMQQPFYASIADLYKQQNQFYAQAGKQFYCRMPWVLSQMTGEEDMAALIESKDMQLEQFRVKIDLAPDGAQQRLITDQQTIPGLMQLGMLDPTTAAQLMGRSIPDDVYAAARQYTKQAAEAAAQQQQQAQAAAEQQAIAMEQAQIADEDAAIAEQETQAQLEMAKIDQKRNAPHEQAIADWNKPDAELAGGMGVTV